MPTLFNISEPLLRRKQKNFDIQDLHGLMQIHWLLGKKTLLCRDYTRIDQVCLLWGLIAAAIFITAQFCSISWHLQAILWSVATILGTVGMTCLSHFWVSVERLRWTIYLWASLMFLGLITTNLGIFCGIGIILLNLSPLWLFLTAMGYIFMGLGIRSRVFILIGLIHLLGIAVLPHVLGWQFFVTGLIMASSLLLLAELQWDMLPRPESAILTSQQREFNRRQNQLRQSQG